MARHADTYSFNAGTTDLRLPELVAGLKVTPAATGGIDYRLEILNIGNVQPEAFALAVWERVVAPDGTLLTQRLLQSGTSSTALPSISAAGCAKQAMRHLSGTCADCTAESTLEPGSRKVLHGAVAPGRSVGEEQVLAATLLNNRIAAASAVYYQAPVWGTLSHVEQRPSGFVAHFNAPIDGDRLALNEVAAPAVQLTSPKGEPITGSLVVAPDRLSVQFVATGGVLATGIHSLRLSGGETGFQGADGTAFDGNHDLPLVYSHKMVRVIGFSEEDVTFRAGQTLLDASGEAYGIVIDKARGLQRARIRISYEPALLKLDDLALDPDVAALGWSLQKELSEGSADLTLTGPALPPGELRLLALQAMASGDFDRDGKADLVLHNPATGQAIPMVLEGTSVEYFGQAVNLPSGYRPVSATDMDPRTFGASWNASRTALSRPKRGLGCAAARAR